MTDKGLHWLRATALLALVAALLGGLLLPVYTDEIGWRFQERAGLDGVDKLYSELCGANTLARPPLFMWPVRWFSALLNTTFAAPGWVRLSGVLYALGLVAMILAIIRRLTDDPRQRATGSTIAIGLLALGVTPLVLVWSRPEQPVVLATCAAMLLALHPAASAGKAWLRSAAIAALAGIALSYHLKGLFVVPLLLGCLVCASRGRAALVPRMVAAAAIAIMAAWAAHYWQARLACPDNARIAAMFAQNSVGAGLRIASAADAWGLLVTMAGQVDVFRYIARAAPVPQPLSHWLEPGLVDAGQWALFLAAISLLWARALLVGAVALVAALVEAVRRRQLDPRLVLSVLLLSAVLGWSATQLISNVYEVLFVLPLLALAIACALAAGDTHLLDGAREAAALAIAVAALASTLAIAALYGGSLVRASRAETYLAAQRNSIPVAGHAGLRPQILAAARACGIPAPRRAQAVMIDDLTYFAFIRSHLPQHQLGVVGLWNGGTDPVAYLKSRHSDGIIVGCHLLPPDLRARAKASGPFCCMGPPGW